MPKNMLNIPCFDDGLKTPMTCPHCGENLRFDPYPAEEVPTIDKNLTITGTLIFCANPCCHKLLGIAEGQTIRNKNH